MTNVKNELVGDEKFILDIPDISSGLAKLPPEADKCGNVEYKRQLLKPSEDRFQHLLTQLLWRMKEGQGTAVYILGVEDDGTLTGLSAADLRDSFRTLQRMGECLQAVVTMIREVDVPGEKKCSEVRIVKNKSKLLEDVHIAVAGNVDAGKSTTLGVLTRGVADNGRGSARMCVFRHRHEVETGRSSSVAHGILGFDPEGKPVNYGLHKPSSWIQIIEKSTKLITFLDLAGHERYLKTTIFGLLSHYPDYVMIAVGANAGMTGMCQEHIEIACMLRIPVFIVVTKVDRCPKNVAKENCARIVHFLRHNCGKQPYAVRNLSDAEHAAAGTDGSGLVPVFKISNVTGEGLDVLRSFLSQLPAREGSRRHTAPEEVCRGSCGLMIPVDSVYPSVFNVGTVVGGTLLSGCVTVGQQVQIGPCKNGRFYPVTIKSIERSKLPVTTLEAGQSGTFALSAKGVDLKRLIRKGQVVLSKTENPESNTAWEVEAETEVLHHHTTISPSFQSVMHCGSVTHPVCMTGIVEPANKECLRNGDNAVVRLRFLKHPEYVRVGDQLILRDGRPKAVGKIVAIKETVNRWHGKRI